MHGAIAGTACADRRGPAAGRAPHRHRDEAGLKQGALLTIALTLELFSLGLAMAVQFGTRRLLVRVLAPTCIACLMIVGAGVGRTLLADASVHTLAGLLSFECAALLFLVTEELLIEAHESADTAVTTAMFFVGFLLFLLLGMVD